MSNELLLTLDEEYKLRLKWKKLNPDTRVSWRDYWLKAQIAKVRQLYPIMYQEEADEVGDFIRRGWMPPLKAKTLKQEGALEVIEEIEEWMSDNKMTIDIKGFELALWQTPFWQALKKRLKEGNNE